MLDLTVIVPTKGRATLARTLDSIPSEVPTYIIADGPDAFGKAELLLGGIPVRNTFFVRTNFFEGQLGHPQRNLGVRLATTKWLAFMDDDDAYTPDAFDVLEQHLNGTERPHIFQMRYHQHPNAPPGLVLWQTPSLHFGNVGTPMFVVPNLPGKLGRWPSQVGGDYEFIRQTCELQGDPVWVPEVIAEIRP